ALDILVADDVTQNLELLRLTLEKRGHRVVSAADGDEAFNRYRTGRFDVVLMDVHMPGTDGRQATRLIRQYERTEGRPYTPVIALTASVMATDRCEARRAGMDGFAVKPLEVAHLFQEIARVLNDRTAPSVVEAASAAPTSVAVDWNRGGALWGDRASLAARIVTCLGSVGEDYPLPDPEQREVDGPALVFSLHGIRGAAGNLALMAASRLAGDLEGLCREDRVDEVMSRLDDLSALLLAARHEAATARPADPDEEPIPAVAAPDAPPGGSVSMLELTTALETLLPILERNELDDAALAQVCARLIAAGRRDHVQILRVAL